MMLKAHDIPNIITIVRLILVLPVIYCLINAHYGTALILFLIAGISDGLDGFLARHYGWQSRLGGMLDPLADKVLLVSTVLIITMAGLMPIWLMLLVVARDLAIVIGAFFYNFKIEQIEVSPLISSKLNTLTLIVTVVVILLQQSSSFVPDWLVSLLIAFCTLTTLVSGIQYLWVWGNKVHQHQQPR